ncbi:MULTISPECIES: DUF7882 family protein [Leucobacter]|uniref:DUF7882 family protein n=1 Tax=Leucobacter TaxID=55968 RepID=UPI0006A77754|nr:MULTISPECIES: hypothetical protein [Leucobacter]
MGYILHGEREYQFEDRTLAHLKTVIGQKLAKREGFFLSWTQPPEEGSGRNSLWISEHTTIAFRFSGAKAPELNPEWLHVLAALSHSTRGLTVISESEAAKYAKRNPLIA